MPHGLHELNLQRQRGSEPAAPPLPLARLLERAGAAMLDSRMVYSCAYWARASDLEQAQLDKLDLIGRKLGLDRGERLLDVGCGWGGLAAHAAQAFGSQVVGATVSHEQATLARQRCAGLPVHIELADWRSLQGRYDKLVSVGMFEYVGQKNHRRYFQRLRGLLEPDGLFLLHTIGCDRTTSTTNAWTERYISGQGRLWQVVLAPLGRAHGYRSLR